MTLLPQRTSTLPEELTVIAPSGTTVDLVAMQDDWYQDIELDNLGSILREGLVWRFNDTGQEWLLSGREVFVLAGGTAHRGLVSCARLVLGREHALLCTTSLLPAVEAVLKQAGCDDWMRVDENDGAPHGWVVLRGVTPHDPVPWLDDGDILNVIRPLPRTEIALEGGIHLGYASWLVAHQPDIRVYGDVHLTGAVLIDGQETRASADGSYTAPGWDSPGTHQVWCNGAIRTYSLVHSEPPSQEWAALSFPSPGSRSGERLAICGPLVRGFTNPEADGDDAVLCEVLQVPSANPILLGSVPGQIFVSHPGPGGAMHWLPRTSVPFAPVWALPARPLRCDKRENSVLLIGELAAPGEFRSPPANRSSIEQWFRLIRDAGRKGLPVKPATPTTAELWGRYKRCARGLWKKGR